MSEGTSIRINIRICGVSTSISLRKNLIALWILMTRQHPTRWRDNLNDFVYKSSGVWTGESAKGFSDFVTERMILTLMEQRDRGKYKTILKKI